MAFGLVLVWIAAVDWRSRRIPNSLVIPLAFGGVVHAVVATGLWAGLGACLGIVVGAGLLFVSYARGWMGAGDVKLLGAIGAWTGVPGVLWVLLVASVLGGALSVIALLRATPSERRRVRDNLVGVALTGQLNVEEPAELPRARGIPFGVALSVSAVGLTVLGGP